MLYYESLFQQFKDGTVYKVIPVQGNATYSFGACSRNESAQQEEELQSECDVLGHVLV